MYKKSALFINLFLIMILLLAPQKSYANSSDTYEVCMATCTGTAAYLSAQYGAFRMCGTAMVYNVILGTNCVAGIILVETYSCREGCDFLASQLDEPSPPPENGGGGDTSDSDHPLNRKDQLCYDADTLLPEIAEEINSMIEIPVIEVQGHEIHIDQDQLTPGVGDEIIDIDPTDSFYWC